jgi:hypothetical protein
MTKTGKKEAITKALPAKKAAPLKRSSSPKPDMPKLLEIFGSLRKLMKKYEPPMNARVDIEGKYDLWSEKAIETFGRRYDAMSFVSIVIQGGYVGFYYMPVYCNPEMAKSLSPDLMKLLKGKACFHVKSLNKDLEQDIKTALEIGFKDYKSRGWV